MNPLERFFLQN